MTAKGVGLANSARRVNVETVTTTEALAGLEPVWNQLLARSRANSLFLTWEWVWTWWRVYGVDKRLNILIARDSAGAIVGLAPLMARSNTVLGTRTGETVSFIGSGSDVTPEYLDFIAPDEWAPTVVTAFIRKLLANSQLDELHLRPLAIRSSNLELIAHLLSQSGTMRRKPGSRCPIVPLPSSTEHFLSTRTRNYRKKLGEFQRRCTRRYAAKIRRAATADEARRDLVTLRNLHQRRWQGKSRAFRSVEYVTFHNMLSQRMFERGWLRIYSMESDATTLASLYGYAYAGRFFYYQSGRDPSADSAHVGLVLMHEVILDSIRDGLTTFDFLSGDEHYKYRWATSQDGSDELTYWRSRSVRALSTMRNAVHRLKEAFSSRWGAAARPIEVAANWSRQTPTDRQWK